VPKISFVDEQPAEKPSGRYTITFVDEPLEAPPAEQPGVGFNANVQPDLFGDTKSRRRIGKPRFSVDEQKWKELTGESKPLEAYGFEPGELDPSDPMQQRALFNQFKRASRKRTLAEKGTIKGAIETFDPEQMMTRASAAYGQTFMDAILGTASLFDPGKLSYIEDRDATPIYTVDEQGRRIMQRGTPKAVWASHLPHVDIMSELDRRGLLMEANVLDRTSEYFGHALAFATLARGFPGALPQRVHSAMLAASGSARAAGLSSFGATSMSLGLLNTVTMRAAAGSTMKEDNLSTQDYQKSALFALGFTAFGAASHALVEAIKPLQNNPALKNIIANYLFGGLESGMAAYELREGGFTQKEREEIFARGFGTGLGFSVMGMHQTLFNGPTRSFSNEGMRHQIKLSGTVVKEMGPEFESFARQGKRQGMKPETTEKVYRAQAEALYENSQVRLSGEKIDVTAEDLMIHYGLSAEAATGIIKRGIPKERIKTITENKIKQGKIQLAESIVMLPAAETAIGRGLPGGEHRSLVVFETAYQEGLLPPAELRSYEALRKEMPKETLDFLQDLVPKTEEVLRTAKEDPRFEAAVDGLLDSKKMETQLQELKKQETELAYQERAKEEYQAQREQGRYELGQDPRRPESKTAAQKRMGVFGRQRYQEALREAAQRRETEFENEYIRHRLGQFAEGEPTFQEGKLPETPQRGQRRRPEATQVPEGEIPLTAAQEAVLERRGAGLGPVTGKRLKEGRRSRRPPGEFFPEDPFVQLVERRVSEPTMVLAEARKTQKELRLKNPKGHYILVEGPEGWHVKEVRAAKHLEPGKATRLSKAVSEKLFRGEPVPDVKSKVYWKLWTDARWRQGESRQALGKEVMGKTEAELGKKAQRSVQFEKLGGRGKVSDAKGIRQKLFRNPDAAAHAAQILTDENPGMLFVAKEQVAKKKGAKVRYKVIRAKTGPERFFDIYAAHFPPKFQQAIRQAEQLIDLWDSVASKSMEMKGKLPSAITDLGVDNVLAIGLTSAGMLWAASRGGDDEEKAKGMGLAGLPIWLLRLKRKGAARVVPTPVERSYSEEVVREYMNREARDAAIRRAGKKEVELSQKGKGPSPRETERLLGELEKQTAYGENGIEPFRTTWVDENGAEITAPGWLIRRKMFEGDVYRQKLESVSMDIPTEAQARAAERVSGMGKWATSVGAGLSAVGPGGKWLNQGIQDATWNIRVRLANIADAMKNAGWTNWDKKWWKELSMGEYHEVSRMLEEHWGFTDIPKTPASERLMESISRTDRDFARHFAEAINQMVTGEKFAFVKEGEPHYGNVPRMIDLRDMQASALWNDVNTLKIREGAGFLNPGGSYVPVKFREEALLPIPSTVYETIESLTGVKVPEFLGNKADPNKITRYYERVQNAKRAAELIYDSAVKQGVMVADELNPGKRRLITHDDVVNVLSAYRDAWFQSDFQMPLHAYDQPDMRITRAGHIEKSRLLDVLVMRDWDLNRLFRQYFFSGVRRVEMARVFGPNYERAAAMLNAMRDAGYKAEHARDLFNIATGSHEPYNKARANAFLDAIAGGVIPIRYLGAAGVSQLTSWAKTGAHTELVQWLKGWAPEYKKIQKKELMDAGMPESKADAEAQRLLDLHLAQTGVLMNSEFQIIMANNLRGFMPKMGTAFLNNNGVIHLDRIGRRHGAITGASTFRSYRSQLEAAREHGKPKIETQMKRLLKELFDDPGFYEMATKEKLTEGEYAVLEGRAGARIGERAHARTEIIDMPGLVQHPVGKHFYSLQQFPFRMTAETLTQFRRMGEMGWNKDTAKMVAKLAALVGFGYGLNRVRDALTRRDNDDPWWVQLGDAASQSGLVSLFFDAYSEFWAERYGEAEMGRVAGPVYVEAWDSVMAVKDAVRFGTPAPIQLLMLEHVPQPARGILFKKKIKKLREKVREAEREG